MNILRPSTRAALAALAFACAGVALPTTSMAGVGLIGLSDLTGGWTATLNGVTGCGPSAMHVAIVMNTAGVGTATLTTHGQCGNSVLSGQTFKVLTLTPQTGAGTANLTCGPGCGWNLRIQVSPDRSVMNLVDVDPVNPGNYIGGMAIHQ